MRKLCLIIIMSCLFLSACKKDKDISLLKIMIGNVDVEAYSANIEGQYVYDYTMDDFFVIYGLSSDLVDAESVKMNVEDKNLSVYIDNLQKNTLYYFCIECRSRHSSKRSDISSFTTENILLPDVTTKAVTEITQTSAVSGGEVISDGGDEVIARGLCWSTSQNPTIDDNHTNDGVGTGIFTTNISDLAPNTTYYLRAYATNSEGTSYGEELSFITLDEEIIIFIPTVTTADITEITQTSAVSGGDVTSDGGAEVIARGLCWSTSQNPTIDDNHTNDGVGTGIFTTNLSDLVPNTTYYLRAYATNSVGTAYGEERVFTTLEEIIIVLPTVITAEVTDITQSSAISGGEVISDGGVEVIARGLCWSTSQNPTIENDTTIVGNGLGVFVSDIAVLTENTTYYMRAYATSAHGTAYGEEKCFTTLKVEIGGDINGFEWVDLGLPSGLKWSMHNIGASIPEEYGNYYAWGEIETKTEYTVENSVTHGVHMSDISGDAEYDAARANWGSTWRLPTKADHEEIIEYCTWIWLKHNDVWGYRIIGTNGNYIFIPASGYLRGTSVYGDGECAGYWNSKPSDDKSKSLSLGINSSIKQLFSSDRYAGQTIRPVSD